MATKSLRVFKVLSGKPPVYAFKGQLDEDCTDQLEKLRNEVEDAFVVDFTDVAAVNSCGLAEWMEFLTALPEDCSISYRNCPPAIVACLNLTPDFQGRAVVESVLVPYFCSAGHDDLVSLPIAKITDARTLRKVCRICKAQMTLEESIEDYAHFLFRERSA